MLCRFLIKQAFSTSQPSIPLVDITSFLYSKNDCLNDCKAVAEAFEKTSCLIIRDPRVKQVYIDELMNLMEAFYESRGKRYYAGERNLEDFYPQYTYQTGAAPDQFLMMRDHSDIIAKYTDEHKPATTYPPKPDSKWRYLWRIGERSNDPKHIGVDPPVHIPKDFPEWKNVMDNVGYLLLQGMSTVSEMLALGLGFERDIFTKMLKGGPQLLCANGSDLTRYELNTTLSAFHCDMNFLTIHGKSRYPGLSIWLKTGERVKVTVPEGHLLLQVGTQLEMLTGGHLQAGFHEVAVSEEVKKRLEIALKEKKSSWRINATLFASLHPDVILEPQGKFATSEAIRKYPPITAQEQMERELADTHLIEDKQIGNGSQQQQSL